MDNIVRDKYGIKVIHYLVKPRHPRFFPKELAAFLSCGDGNEASKKSPALRQKELLSAIAVTLLKYLASNLDEFAFDTQKSLLALSILDNTLGRWERDAV